MFKRKEIFTQTVIKERITIKQGRTAAPDYSACSKCRTEVDWLSVGEVSALINRDVNEIRDLISRGELDIKIGSERLSVCAESVRRVISNR